MMDPQGMTVSVEGQEVDARQVFCTFWPMAEVAIRALTAIAPGLPGVGWMVGLGAGVILSAGSSAYKSLGCGPSPLDHTQASNYQASAEPYMR